jgi:hypothetical protein
MMPWDWSCLLPIAEAAPAGHAPAAPAGLVEEPCVEGCHSGQARQQAIVPEAHLLVKGLTKAADEVLMSCAQSTCCSNQEKRACGSSKS